MTAKEFGKRCQRCNKKGGDTFARMYYRPIDGHWKRLCNNCWNIVEQGAQSGSTVLECDAQTRVISADSK